MIGDDAKLAAQVEDLLSRGRALKSDRGPYEERWGKMARIMRPWRDDFAIRRSPGQNRTRSVYDGTGIRSADNFAAGIFGSLTNPANQWVLYEPADPDLKLHEEEQNWVARANVKLHQSLQPGQSAFYQQIFAFYADIGVFGNAGFWSTYSSNAGRFRDRTLPLGQTYVEFDAYGDHQATFRCYPLTSRALVKKFGEANLTDEIVADAKKAGVRAYDVWHAIVPNDELRPGAIGKPGKAWHGFEILDQTAALLLHEGFDENPAFFARWALAGDESYGRGPGDLAYADVATLQAQERTLLQVGERAANPPILAPDRRSVRVLRTTPGKITYGAVNGRGTPLVRTLDLAGSVPVAIEMTQARREAIQDAFYFSLMQMVGRSGMSATEVIERQQEKMRLMGPYLGAMQAEFLGPFIERRTKAMARRGMFGPIPPRLADVGLSLNYLSAAVMAQRSEAAAATMRVIDVAERLSRFNPEEVARNLDIRQALRIVQDGVGAPAAVLRSEEELAEMMEQAAQGQQTKAALEAGREGAGIVESLARAGRDAALGDQIAAG